MEKGTESINGTYNENGYHNGELAESPKPKGSLPIAIIGMSCKFPGDATNPERFWRLCAEGRSAWSPIPEDRFNRGSFFHPNGENSGTVR